MEEIKKIIISVLSVKITRKNFNVGEPAEKEGERSRAKNASWSVVSLLMAGKNYYSRDYEKLYARILSSVYITASSSMASLE